MGFKRYNKYLVCTPERPVSCANKYFSMYVPLISLKVEQLADLLQQKTALYNQMIDDNKEFEEVKHQFLEIKEIVALLGKLQE